MKIPSQKIIVTSLVTVGATFALLSALTQPGVKPRVTQPPPVSIQNLETHVRFLAQTLYPRSVDQPEKLAQAAHYIAQAFRSTGAALTEQPVPVTGQTGKYFNIIAHFGPRNGVPIIVGAHYDADSKHKNDDGSYALETHTPGADDNASGVAGLLELARLLAQNPPSRPVDLIAYTLEEDPPEPIEADMGSHIHALSLRQAGQPIQLMISMEMIGYFRDGPGSQHYSVPGLQLLYPTQGHFLALVGRFSDFNLTQEVKSLLAGATDLPVYSVNAPSFLPGISDSDHESYWAENYPAFMVTDTAFERNPHYHQAGDTPETLDYVRMAKVVQGVYMPSFKT